MTPIREREPDVAVQAEYPRRRGRLRPRAGWIVEGSLLAACGSDQLHSGEPSAQLSGSPRACARRLGDRKTSTRTPRQSPQARARTGKRSLPRPRRRAPRSSRAPLPRSSRVFREASLLTSIVRMRGRAAPCLRVHIAAMYVSVRWKASRADRARRLGIKPAHSIDGKPYLACARDFQHYRGRVALRAAPHGPRQRDRSWAANSSPSGVSAAGEGRASPSPLRRRAASRRRPGRDATAARPRTPGAPRRRAGRRRPGASRRRGQRRGREERLSRRRVGGRSVPRGA